MGLLLFQQLVVELDSVFGLGFGTVQLADALLLSVVNRNTVLVVLERWRLLLLDNVLLLGALNHFALQRLGFATDDLHHFILIRPRHMEMLQWV